MRVIYIDVLLCINLVINFLLLSASAYYLHEDPCVLRLIAGAAVGAVGSLVILLPVMPFVVNMAIKAAIGALTVYAAFEKRPIRQFIKVFAVFLAATFFFGGAVTVMWFIFTPRSLVIKNSVVYLSVSPLILVLLSILCYFVFRLIYAISGQAKIKQEMCILTVTTNAGILRTAAKIDTGNSLKEPFSQCPVIVMTRRSAEAITPDQLKEYETVTTLTYRENISGVRFVPFTAVGGRGILPCFLAKEVRINDRLCNEIVYIALCANDSLGEYKALVPSILC